MIKSIKLRKLNQISLPVLLGLAAALTLLVSLSTQTALGAVQPGDPVLSISKQGASNWQRRIQLTFTNTVAEDLTEFPVLVVLNSSRINYSQTQNAGQDIRFVAADGTLLSHEIERWDEAGNSYIWVRVPQITANSSTDYIWLYYDNPIAPDGQNPAGVWSSDYEGVWHFNGNGEDATAQNSAIGSSTTPANGVLAGGLDFDGNNDFVNVGSGSSLDNVFDTGGTVMAWIYPRSYGVNGFGRVLDKSSTTQTADGWSLQLFETPTNGGEIFNTLLFVRGFSPVPARGAWRAEKNEINLNQWHFVAVTYNDTTPATDPTMYVRTAGTTYEGAIEELPAGITPASDANEALHIGNFPGGEDRSFDGIMDEVRVLTTLRSSAWITAQYRSMTDNFITYGTPEATNTQTGGFVGAPYTYTLTVTNSGSSAATDVVIHDVIPAGASHVSGGELISGGDVVSLTIPSIPAGTAQTAEFVATTCQLNLVNSNYQVVDSAQGVTSAPGPLQISLLTPPTINAAFQAGVPQATIGESINFTDTSTTNGGPIISYNWNFGDGNLATGSTTSHAYAAPGTYTVTLTLTDSCAYTATTQQRVTVVAPALIVTKSAQPEPVAAGRRLTYTIRISNVGLGLAGGVIISDTLPEFTTFVNNSISLEPAAAGDVGSAPPLLASGVTIDSGEQVTVTFAVTVETPPAPNWLLTNTAAVSSNQLSIPVEDSVSTLVIGSPAISITKSGPDIAAVAESIVFTFTATNIGNTRLRIQSISDDVAGTPVFISGDTNGDNWLDLTETWLFSAGYTTQPTDPDLLVNTVTITATDELSRPVSATAGHTTTIGSQPVLALTKQGPTSAVVGQQIVFTFTVSHAADSDRSPVSNLSVVDDFAGAAGLISNGNGNPLLEWGETWQFVATYTVQAFTPNPFINTGLATGQDIDGDVVTATAQHTTQLSGFSPRLFLDKDGPTQAFRGDNITYSYTVINVNFLSLLLFDLGELTIADIGDGSPVSSLSVNDTVTGPATYIGGDFNQNGLLDAAEAWIFTANHTITNIDPDPLVGVATAQGLDAENDVVSTTDVVNTDILDLDEKIYLPAITKKSSN